MSAVSSTTGDRESEALRRAQRAHEPSMEEILASIRNIIADDRENARSTVKGPVQRTAASASGPQIVYSKDADLGLAPRAGSPIGLKADRPEEAGTAELVSPRVVWSYAPASEEPYAEAQTPVPAAAEPEARLEPKEATARIEPPPDDRSIEAVGNSGAPIAAAERPVIEFCRDGSASRRNGRSDRRGCDPFRGRGAVAFPRGRPGSRLRLHGSLGDAGAACRRGGGWHDPRDAAPSPERLARP